jgi:hypothetical protein
MSANLPAMFTFVPNSLFTILRQKLVAVAQKDLHYDSKIYATY